MTQQTDIAANDGRRSQVNRERLANAAAALFWTRGYAGTSLADIARRSGVPVGNIYYYFKTKASIAEAVGQILRDQMGEALDTIEREQAKPAMRLVALFRLFAAANPARTRTGCPIESACRSFGQDAPQAAAIAAQAFLLAQRWITDNLVAAGQSENEASDKADRWLTQWQGGIALAHALKDQARLDRVTDRLIADAAALAD
jgi:AcrR family transcriptional regulator